MNQRSETPEACRECGGWGKADAEVRTWFRVARCQRCSGSGIDPKAKERAGAAFFERQQPALR
jgi:DnaJ-class molecular chaperone